VLELPLLFTSFIASQLLEDSRLHARSRAECLSSGSYVSDGVWCFKSKRKETNNRPCAGGSRISSCGNCLKQKLRP
jgi:hypothetical protein